MSASTMKAHTSGADTAAVVADGAHADTLGLQPSLEMERLHVVLNCFAE